MVVGNTTDIGSTASLGVAYVQFSANVAAFLLGLSGLLMTAGKRKRRHDHISQAQFFSDDTVGQQTLLKVLDGIDDADCIALTLCHTTSISSEDRTPVQANLVSMLSPQQGTPLPWKDVELQGAKYQYAALIGTLSKSVSNGHSYCSQVFPRCPLPASEVLKIMGSRNLPCGIPLKNLNFLQN